MGKGNQEFEIEAEKTLGEWRGEAWWVPTDMVDFKLDVIIMDSQRKNVVVWEFTLGNGVREHPTL